MPGIPKIKAVIAVEAIHSERLLTRKGTAILQTELPCKETLKAMASLERTHCASLGVPHGAIGCNLAFHLLQVAQDIRDLA